MIHVDDRTEEQKATHLCIVAATDAFMSGWGSAKGGASYVGWACKPEHESDVLHWVHSRREMKRVRQVSSSWRPRGDGHTHIYVVGDNHPALTGGR